MGRKAGPFQSVEDEARFLVERLGGRWTGDGGMCRCPAHDDRTPSLSVRAGRSRLLLHCFAGCAADDILRSLHSNHILARSASALERPREHADLAHSDAALRIWSESVPIAGSPAAAYLAGRGLETSSAELRYHPRAPRGRVPFTRRGPAMIAAVRDHCRLVGIQRTFIAGDGSGLANCRQPRCGLGSFGAGAVRLGGIARRLGLAEGIETALSATSLFGIPCWATLGSARFGAVDLPPGLEELNLFLDNDSGGRMAERLARRAFEHRVRIVAHYPGRRGEDWNDVLRGRPGDEPIEERGLGRGE